MKIKNKKGKGIVMNKLLTVKELQDYLGIGRSKAYEVVNEPRFPALRIGSNIRIPKDLLEEWILEKSNERREING